MLYSEQLKTDCPIRQAMREFYRADEHQVVDHILPLAEIPVAARTKAWRRARDLIIKIRQQQVGKGGIDALLQEFAISTEEGVVLMCLAEALLRVPDDDTADELIRDKLANGAWLSHIGNSESLFVNASSWGLLMTGKLVTYTDKNQKDKLGLLKKTVGRLGEPVVRKAVQLAMKMMGAQFVMGETIQAALERAKDSERKGYLYSYDMLGEGARTQADANRYFESYLQAIEAIGRAAAGRGPEQSPGISIKLSALHPRYDFYHRDQVLTELVPKLKVLALAAKKYDIGFTIDAEEANRLDLSLDVIEQVFCDQDLADWQGFGMAVQAYQKRAIWVIEWIRQLTTQVGRSMMVRLVKGAYWDSEVKDSQVEGYSDYPVFTRKPTTDVCYQACAAKLLEYRDSIYPQFATHNAYTVATILEMTEQHSGFEFQRLHGMGETLYDQVVEQNKLPCRVYAPVGKHVDLLAYLVRRLLENGANSSFVNNIVDESVEVESLLNDPLDTVKAWQNKRHPQICLPAELYGERRQNSAGLDLTDTLVTEKLKTDLELWQQQHITAVWGQTSAQHRVVNPADHSECLAEMAFDTAEQMLAKLDKVNYQYALWSRRSVEQRAELLRKIADVFETNISELIALCIKEAGKTPVDSVAEVREAVDFCRYYANQAEDLFNNSQLPLSARGVLLCISPWNFPLAIFTGQVVAALVTGNTVLAKPAEQTCLVAQRAVELMKSVGLPDGVVEVIVAEGTAVGETLVGHTDIKAVMFTGSTATATWIARRLAAREQGQIPFIAETGGQNCMIVDSTALPEQVVDDVINSGFQSAGQRCSALRVLYLQDDIADKVTEMIIGAMKELTIGDPAMLATDVGPVIDEKALTALQQHSEKMQLKAELLYQCEITDENILGGDNTYFAPHLYQLSDISVLDQEVFGPCVHIIRFKSGQLDQVIEQINSSGYGLTMGLHSRIEERCQSIANKINAGNIYVNRNMIGAVVGVQPFGGLGLSGTGPKAGGPHYLNKLVTPNMAMPMAADKMVAEAKRSMFSRPYPVTQLSEQNCQLWRQQSLNSRLSVVKQLLAEIAIQAEDDIEYQVDFTESFAVTRSELALIEHKLSKPIELPGPTGERNILTQTSRGLMVYLIEQQTSIADCLVSLSIALAAGNSVLLAIAADCLAQQLWAEKFTAFVNRICGFEVVEVIKLEQLEAAIALPHLAAAMCAKSDPNKTVYAQLLAERQGAILPLIDVNLHQYTTASVEAIEELTYFYNQLVHEKTVSINTTAAGGNASLMTIES